MYLRVNKTSKGPYMILCNKYRDHNGKIKDQVVESIGYVHDFQSQFPDPIAHFKQVAREKTEALREQKKAARKTMSEERYQKLLEENSLLLTMDLVKEMINKAYQATTERGMKIFINRAIRTCRDTMSKHFEWFANLLESHMDGIIAHATMALSSGKVEGTNNMIKTLRRKSYGYPDDDYFFLKIMDSSRKFSGAQA